MTPSESVVYVVDDDARVRAAIEDLLCSFGWNVVSFASAAEYLSGARNDCTACLVLDIELPDINGLDLQRQLDPGEHPPIVFITGHGDVPSSVNAMKAGAVDFLPKPFSQDQLVAAVDTALQKHRASRTAATELASLRRRLALLTPRECEVLPLVVSGMLNKQAAAYLGISEVTLQIHRGQVMRKMRAASLADLVRMAMRLGIESMPMMGRSGAAAPGQEAR